MIALFVVRSQFTIFDEISLKMKRVQMYEYFRINFNIFIVEVYNLAFIVIQLEVLSHIAGLSNEILNYESIIFSMTSQFRILLIPHICIQSGKNKKLLLYLFMRDFRRWIFSEI